MRVAFVAESFLPHMNGVTGSVLQSVRHLTESGHETLVIAPEATLAPRPGAAAHDSAHGDVVRLPSVPLPGYTQVRLAMARDGHVTDILRDFAPDVVHLASPFFLGWRGLTAAENLGIPTVAVYQTDVIAYMRRYGVPQATRLTAAHVARLHRRATLTLAPSSTAQRQLHALGVDRVRMWGRGVDTERFAPERRSDAWRGWVAPGKVIVGYVGRLAPEKQVEDLRALRDIPGIQVVIVGDGPSRARVQRYLPDAVFLGHLSGRELAQAVASFDVFVHPGESETFGQTLQEAHASGVPVVATGAGGPVDLVRSSIDGWLYTPGDLGDLRARVQDLAGDESKRRAFGLAARERVGERTWPALVGRLREHYDEAIALQAAGVTAPRARGVAGVATAASTPVDAPVPTAPAPRTWRSVVALGDSITEGLCDTSRMPEGEYRGWADRLATLLAQRSTQPLRYANLAVRSRRVQHMCDEQIPWALEMRPDLVTVLIGANDLVSARPDVRRLGAQVGDAVARLRAQGSDVLLLTPFLPRRRASAPLARRFARFSDELRSVAAAHGAIFLQLDATDDIGELGNWAHDKVHLSSRGHRLLAYRAAEALGVPDAETVGELDAALHSHEVREAARVDDRDEDRPVTGSWLVRDALPWAWRRVRGRTAGDGIVAKHADYIEIPGRGSSRSRVRQS